MMKKIVWCMVAGLVLAGCASELTTREKGAVTGAAIGAGTGAIIGSQTGKGGAGAVIGGAIGAVSGAVIGDAIQTEQQRRQAQSPAPPRTASVQAPGQYSGDPTRGEIVNATRWRIKVYIDVDPGRMDGASSLSLGPQESVPANLDIGAHRIVAQAFVDTQFGQRLVGKYDRTITVDPRASGWTVRLGDNDFR